MRRTTSLTALLLGATLLAPTGQATAAGEICRGEAATIVGTGPTVQGTEGRDVIDGGRRADRIYGGAGNDKIQGGGDKDVLSGGAGNDVLGGKSGRDVAIGGADRDRCRAEVEKSCER